MSFIVTRKLARENHDGHPEIVGQEAIQSISAPVVILGDPGLGKSVLTKALGQLPSMACIPAGKFVRCTDPASLVQKGQRVVIDGLDEVASSAPGGGIDLVLSKLSAIGYPPFVISCRVSDWRGAADRVKIEEDYGHEPVLLHLQPFEYGDANDFLLHEFPDVNAPGLLNHLARRGLEGIYRNPLTLKLLGEVARSDRELPETRAELLDRACREMLREENPHHAYAAHARTSEEELLLAAGAICATQLICDRLGVYDGPVARTPDGYVNLANITPLPCGDAVPHALHTRLFEAEGEHRFTHVHRVLAEYLGASWLAACFDTGLSQRRILALVRHGHGVPTSLRGLHAWIPHFSSALAHPCFAAEPFAVLKYGDAEHLGLTQARDLLQVLKNLSGQDPFFASGDWGRHPASGLMRAELKDELLSIIRAPKDHPHLSMLLIEAMIGTPVAAELEQPLLDIVFDTERAYAERSDAAKALHEAQISIDWQQVIARLLELADADSARLACRILTRLDARDLPAVICIDAVLSHMGLTENTASRDSHVLGHTSQDLFAELDAKALAELLDTLVASAQPFLEQADRWAPSSLADLVRRRAQQILEADSSVPAQRVWNWIGAFDGHDGLGKDSRENLGRVIRENRRFHESLLEHVLLTPCASGPWMAAFALHDAGLGLDPTPEDVCTVLRILRCRATDTPINPDTWRQVLRIQRSADGLPETVRTTAAEVAHGDPKLLAILDEMSTATVPEWKERQRRRDAEDRAERQAVIQSHRDFHKEHVADVAAGMTHALEVSAGVYLGRFRYFRDSNAPHLRVLEFLGHELGVRALDGFIAVLERTDLPSARQIADAHSRNKPFHDELLMICGIMELVRRGRSLSAVDRPTLAATYMAWQRCPESNSPNTIDIGAAIETVLFQSMDNVERHFRTAIEPQFANQTKFVTELYSFTREKRWRSLSARLAIEWLETIPSMPAHARTDLMMCALAGAPRRAAHPLLLPELDSIRDDNKALLLSLLAYFVLEFDSFSVELQEIVETHSEFLWVLRDLSTWPSAELLSRLSMPQQVFIVNVLGVPWPDTQRPTGVTSGDTNPWDASHFIRNVIFSIAANPAPEATDVLEALTAGPAQTYRNVARRALAQQRQVRLDFEYAPPTVAHLQSVMTQGLPESVDDMRVYFLDRLDTLQVRIRGSSTDMWQTYWADGKPRHENFCRDRTIDLISGSLPESIRFEPEMHMPGQTRADIAAIRDSIGLPVEIKGQWHKDVWNAATDQLDAKYSRDWRAQGRDTYIVLWFGNVSGKQLRPHPDGLDPPDTPESLQRMLEDRLPEEKRSLIDVFVMDVANAG